MVFIPWVDIQAQQIKAENTLRFLSTCVTGYAFFDNVYET